MSKTNRSAKQELIRLYGAECFIEKLHLRDDTEREYTGKAQYKRMKQLTFHHIVEKQHGGKSTVENGALLSEENHIWFNQQPKELQRQINNMFQEYKANFDIQCVSVVATEKGLEVEELEQTETIELPEEIQRGYIPVELNEEEQQMYEQRKKERNKRIKQKMEGEER